MDICAPFFSRKRGNHTMAPAVIDLDKAKLDPQSVFSTPQEVIDAPGLTPDDKKAILVRWEADVDSLLRATEEGMPPSESHRSAAELLRAVHLAIESLDGETTGALS
jgi:hypothetical protein